MRHNRFTAAAAGVLLAVGVGAGLAACSSSSSPPNATTVLQNDGYTPNSALDSALQSGLDQGGSPTGISSSAAGLSSDGSSIELVIVVSSASEASAVTTELNSEYASEGITTTSNGDVVTADGSYAAFSSAGD
jgi:hypothetical protein